MALEEAVDLALRLATLDRRAEAFPAPVLRWLAGRVEQFVDGSPQDAQRSPTRANGESDQPLETGS
ncbi:MAG: hypothetical protein AB1609_20465 [Bacillota bacterium]